MKQHGILNCIRNVDYSYSLPLFQFMHTSKIIDFRSKEVNFSTTCSSCLACSGGLRAKGTQERGQTHTYKHNSICCFIWGGPQAGVTWSRTNCAKLALETHKNKKKHNSAFPPQLILLCKWRFEATKALLTCEHSHTTIALHTAPKQCCLVQKTEGVTLSFWIVTKQNN